MEVVGVNSLKDIVGKAIERFKFVRQYTEEEYNSICDFIQEINDNSDITTMSIEEK